MRTSITRFLLLSALALPMAAAPTVRELIPASAPSGARLFVSGQELSDSGISVAFAAKSGTVPATVVGRTDKTIEVIVPPSAVTGNVHVAKGSTSIADVAFTLAADPTYAEVHTLAGGPSTPSNSVLKAPFGAAVVTPNGNVYVADTQHYQIKLITPAGVTTVFAGSGNQGNTDGAGTAAQFKDPRGITWDPNANVLYVTDSGNSSIRRVTMNGVVTTIAGNGNIGYADGTGSSAQFKDPRGITVAPDGTIYVADSGNDRIRKITPGGVVTTFAGSGKNGKMVDGAALSANFKAPEGIIASGDVLYVADTGDYAIRKIAGGQVTTVYSNGGPGDLKWPSGIVVDEAGNLIIGDTQNNLLRRIDLRGTAPSISTIAGTGLNGWVDGPAAKAQFKNPAGIAIAGAIFIADQANDAIRTLCPEVRITGIFVPATTAGTDIRIFGTGFVPGQTTVTINGTAASKVTWINSTTISATLASSINGSRITVTAGSCAGTSAPYSTGGDGQPPSITVKESGQPFADGTKLARDAVITFSAVDDSDPNPTVTATLDTNAFTTGTTVSTEAFHTLVVTATDSSGNSFSVTIHFVIDKTPPVVTVHEGTNPFVDGTLFNRAIVINLGIQDLTATKITDSVIDGQPYTIGQPFATEGAHTFSANVTDDLGHTTPAGPVHFTIDTTPPNLTITSPADGSVTGTSKIVVTGSSDDAVSVKVNGVDATINTTTHTYTSPQLTLSEGTNTITVTGADLAGNPGSAVAHVTLDSQGPQLAIAAPKANACLKDASVTVSGTVSDSDLASVTVHLGSSTVAATLDSAKHNWSASVPVATEGRATFIVEAADSSGHTTTQQVSVNIDRTAPAIVVTESGEPFTATLVDRPVALFIRVNDADVNASYTTTIDGAAFQSGNTVTGDRSHTLSVTATDCAGNTKTQTYTFTIDTTPPTIRNVLPATGTNAGTAPASVTGVTDTDVATVTVLGTSISATPDASGAFTFTGIRFAEGVNHFTFEAKDRAGHTGQYAYTLGLKSSAPVVEIIENGLPIVDGTIYTRTVHPNARTNDTTATLTATLDSGPFTLGNAVTTNGSHTIVATATDTYGHKGEARATFTIDTTGPAVKIVAPAVLATNASSTDVRVTADDSESVLVNGVSAVKQSNGEWLVTGIPLEIGENPITATGRDHAGNTGRDSIVVTRGGTGPALVVTFPPDNHHTNRPKLDVTGRVITPANVTSVSVEVPPAADATAVFEPISGDFKLAGVTLREGDTIITATAHGTNGQNNTVKVKVTADFTPPLVRILESDKPLDDGARLPLQAVLSATATDQNAPVAATLIVDGVTVTTPTLTVSAAGGHTAVATAQDTSGNQTRIARTFFIGNAAGAGCKLEGFDPIDGSIVTASTTTLTGKTGGAVGVKVNGVPALVASGTFSATVELSREGANVITIVCTDANGTPAGTAATITLNRVTAQPSITIIAPAEGFATANETTDVTGTVDSSVTSVDVNGAPATLTGTNWIAKAVHLAEGWNVLAAHGKTAGNKVAAASRRVLYLKAAPTITITSPLSGFVTGTSTVDVAGTWTNLDPLTITAAGQNGSAASIDAPAISDTTGSFIAHGINLSGGVQTITVSGRDRTGRAASATVQVELAGGAPSIHITSPADNTSFGSSAGTSFTIRGTFHAAAGSTIEIGSSPVTIDAAAGTFTASVPFSTTSNATATVARLAEPGGAAAFDAIRVKKLDAPKVTDSFPAANAIEVDPGVRPLVAFSAPMDGASVKSAFSVTGPNNTPVTGQVYVDNDVLTFVPAALLASGTTYTFSVSTAAKDVAGEAITSAFSSSFTVGLSAPSAPSVTPVTGPLCGQTVTIRGTAAPNARISIEFAPLTFSTTADAGGAFSYPVPVSGHSGYSVIRVRVIGSDGSQSPATDVPVDIECGGPQVIGATYDRTVNKLTITFSRDLAPATVTGALALQLGDGTLVAGTTTMPSGAIVILTPAQDLTKSSFTLNVATTITDTAGTHLQSPYSQTFTYSDEQPVPSNGKGFIAGEAFDATNGRPLTGATVTVASNEVPTKGRGDYVVPGLVEGAYTIKVAKDGYTTAWRQIVVTAGSGVVPIDIRLTQRGSAQTAGTGALSLTRGGDTIITRPVTLTIPAGGVTSGASVTLTATGTQSLAGLLPLGWSPLAAAEIVTSASSISGAQLAFTVPASDITAASQTLTAVRYDETRDEWRVIVPAAGISGTQAVIPIGGAGSYALVYPDKRTGLTKPNDPSTGAVLAGVADRCTTQVCPPLTSTGFPIDPTIIVPGGRTSATLQVDGRDPNIFPSGTAVQAYVEEDLTLADGTRVSEAPFAADLLLYRSLDGNSATAGFHVGTGPNATTNSANLQLGFEHVRVEPYPGRLDRGTLIGPQGGRVPGDDKISLDIATDSVQEPIHATAAAMPPAQRDGFGPIAGYAIVGGFTLIMDQTTAQPSVDIDGDGVIDGPPPVELSQPARATYTIDSARMPSANAQVILVEVLDATPFGRIVRLAARMSALDSTRYTTDAIDRADLPIDGVIRAGRYLLLAAQRDVAFATGGVRRGSATGPLMADARVLAAPLGVADLTRATGIYNVPVPAAPAAPFTLQPRSVPTGDGALYTNATAPARGQVVHVPDLTLVAQPPAIASTSPAANATNVALTTNVTVNFNPGIEPNSVTDDSITVLESESGKSVTGHATANGALGVVWTLPAGDKLKAGTRYTVFVAPSIRGTSGAPYGRTYSFSFTTLIQLTSSEVHPEKIHISMPVNGVSRITATGALPTGWTGTPVRRGHDFITHRTGLADASGSFTIDIGSPTGPDVVTIEDTIDLQVLNNAGNLTAIIRLTPFVTADGKGFVAPADIPTHFVSVDNITVDVPVGAFDKPTMINVVPAAKAVFAGVPSLDSELDIAAVINLTFDGEAKKPLELSIPTQPGFTPGNGQWMLGLRGESVRGPRIMAVDTLAFANGAFTTRTGGTNVQAHIVTMSASKTIRPTSGETRNINAKDMLLRVIEAGSYAAFQMSTGAAGNGMTYCAMFGIAKANDLFWDTMASMYVGYRYVAEKGGNVVFPVPAGKRFTVTGLDPATGLKSFQRTYDPLPVGDPGVGTVVPSADPDLNGPYPVFASPMRIESATIAAADVDIESVRNIKMHLDTNGILTVSPGSDPLPSQTRVSILDTNNGTYFSSSLPFTITGASPGDDVIVAIERHDVDPAASISVVFNEPIDVGGATDEDPIDTFLKTVIKVEQLQTYGPPIDLGPQSRMLLDSDRRVTILLPAQLASGTNFRVRLLQTIKDRSGSGLQLGQRGTVDPSTGSIVPTGAAHDIDLLFDTRKPGGNLGSFDIRQSLTSQHGTMREADSYGNILFVAALDGGILAYDTANPAGLVTSTLPPTPLAMVGGTASDGPPVTSQWSVKVDHHGRVYATGQTNMFGVLRSYRVEDFIKAHKNPTGCLQGMPASVCTSHGATITSLNPGAGFGVGLPSQTVVNDRVEAIPRKLQIAVIDADPVEMSRDDFFASYCTGGTPDDLGNDLKRCKTIELPMSGSAYRVQRITVENNNLSLRWSGDAGPDPANPANTKKAKLENVFGNSNDTFRILYNQSTYAVVSLLGYGIQVLDLNAVESNDAPGSDPAPPEEQVALTDAQLTSCSEGGCPPIPISNLRFSPDSAVLPVGAGSLRVYGVDSRHGVLELQVHPPSGVGRNGETDLTSGTTSIPDHPRFAALKAAMAAAGLTNPNTRFTSAAVYHNPNTNKDYVLVTALDAGLIALEGGATPLSDDSFADVVWFPRGAMAIRVIEKTNMGVVVDGDGRVLLVDLSRLDERTNASGAATTGLFPSAAAALAGSSGYGFGADDARILWRSDPGVAAGQIPPIVDPDTGMLFGAAFLGKTISAVAALDPKIKVLADTGSGPKEVTGIVPLGVAPPDGVLKCDPSAADCHASLAAFRVIVPLPGAIDETVGSTINMAVESETVEGAEAPQTPAGFPKAHLRVRKRDGSNDPRPTSNFGLHRILDIASLNDEIRYQKGYNRFASPWIVAIADPRAAKDYVWPSGADKASLGCPSCDRPAYLQNNSDVQELWSGGHFIAIHPETSAFGATSYSYLGDDTKRLETRLSTIPGDLVRPSDGATDLDKVAGKSMPRIGTIMNGNISTNTGELLRNTVDLSIKGRAGMDFALSRFYDSAIAHIGPFGRNVDSPLFTRVRPLPNGDVDLYDGTGRKETFKAAGGSLTPPKGVFVDVRRTSAGIVVQYTLNTRLLFDSYGRLAVILDRNTTTTGGSDGNQMHFVYGLNGKLESVIDSNGRRIKFDYYTTTGGVAWDGAISRVTDFDSRIVDYQYDGYGRLANVSGPDPQSLLSQKPSTTYFWSPAVPTGDKAALYTTGQLTGEQDGMGRSIFSIGYHAAYPWSVTNVSTGGGTWDFTPDTPVNKLTDPNLHTWQYTHDSEGRITAVTDPIGATTQLGYDSEGRVATVTHPMGDVTTYNYTVAAGSDPRPKTQVEKITETPRSGSPEAVTNSSRVTQVGYGAANLPTSVTGPDGATTTIARDERGNPQSGSDASGAATSYTYDEHGLLKTITDSRTGNTTFNYITSGPKQGYIDSTTTSDGTTHYGVDARGNVTSVTAPGNKVTTLTVNKLDQVERVVSGGSERTTAYDAAQNPTTMNVLAGTTPAGTPLYSTKLLNIDEIGRLHTVTENGVMTTYSYDPARNLMQITRPALAPTTFGYNARNDVISFSRANGQVQVTYDPDGAPQTMTDPRTKVRQFAQNGFGETVGEKSPTNLNHVTTIDPKGRPIARRILKDGASGQKLLLQWTEYQYDAMGRVTREVRKLFRDPLVMPLDGSDPTGTIDVVTTTEYDDVAHTQTVTDPRGKKTITQLDDLGRARRVTDPMGNVVEITYDENGNKAAQKTIDKRPDGTTETHTMLYEYDAQNRVVAEFDTSDSSHPVVIRSHKYDSRGNVISSMDADGNVRKFEYDIRNHRVKETDPENGETRYSYDDAGHVTLIRDANGNETAFTYNAHGNVESITRPGGATWHYTYDENGNKTSATDANGTAITYSYDDEDRLTGQTITRGNSVLGPSHLTWTHDDLGRVTATETDEGVKTTSVYDSLDRLLEESLQIDSGPKRTVRSDYDLAGNPVSLTYPSGLQLTRTFDALDRISTIATAGSPTPVIGYSDAGSKLIGKVLGNGIAESLAYDPQQRIKSITDSLGASVVRGMNYGWSLAGNRLTIDRSDLNKRWTLGYNHNAWINSEEIDRTDTDINPLQKLTQYDIDPTQNYRSITTTLPTTPATTISTSINQRNQYTSFGGASLTYDPNGNLTGRPAMTLQYDFDNHLKKTTSSDGWSLEAFYAADGAKVREVLRNATGTRTTDYVLDGSGVIEQYVNDSLSERYVRGRGIDEIVRAERSSRQDGTLDQTLFPLQDEFGNTDALTSQSGAMAERYEYSGYGGFRTFGSDGAERAASAYDWRWLFQGRPYDWSLHSYDFRARTLWPDIGRFGQQDPLGMIDSPNLYQAFGDAWTDHRDPTGRDLLEGEIATPPPYGPGTGVQAHLQWGAFLATQRIPIMGVPLFTAFYDFTINEIREHQGRGPHPLFGMKRPDAARLGRFPFVVGPVEFNFSTIWELKPPSYDPSSGGSNYRHNEARWQLGNYYSALWPNSHFGFFFEPHPTGPEQFGEIEQGDRVWALEAYNGSGWRGGMVYYRLKPLKKREQREPVRELVHELATEAPCLVAMTLVGAGAGATAGAEIGVPVGAVVGGAGGTVVEPGGGTVGGAVGGGVVGGLGGAEIGSAVGAGVGLAIGLAKCHG